MARPRKTGLDYFPFDCDFFQDEKIVAIAGEFGIKGEIVAIKLLCAVYRNGYFIEWNEMQRAKILRQVPGVSADLFDQILNRLIRWGFFDASLFGSVKVLTSVGIQRRYFEVTKFRKKDTQKPEYILIPEIKDYSYERGEIGVSQGLTPVSQGLTPVSQGLTPQIKGNKNKKESPKGDKKKGGGTLPGLDEPKQQRKQPAKMEFTSPTLEEVLEYFRQNWKVDDDSELQGKLFFSYYDSLGWCNSRGTPLKRWDSAASSWICRKELENKQKTNEQNNQSRSVSTRSGIAMRSKYTPECGLEGHHKDTET